MEVSRAAPRSVPTPTETEKGYQHRITQYADLRGWTWYHPFLSIHSPRGWPDLALCRPPRLVLAEIKGSAGKVSPAQERWLELLRQCPPIEAYVWFPRDWDQVIEILK